MEIFRELETISIDIVLANISIELLVKAYQHSDAFVNLQGTPVNIIVGSHVWVEDSDVAWIDGEVEKINGEEVVIQARIGKKASLVVFH